MRTIPKAEMLRRLNLIYSQIPSFECTHCHQCSNPIFWFYPEEVNIRDYLKNHDLEYLTFSEDEFKHNNLRCPYLKEDRCSIYPVRPIVCRLQGTIPELYCPHYKLPLLSENKCRLIVKKLTDLTREMGVLGQYYGTRKEANGNGLLLTKILNK